MSAYDLGILADDFLSLPKIICLIFTLNGCGIDGDIFCAHT